MRKPILCAVFGLLVGCALGAVLEVSSGGAPAGESDLPTVKLTLDSGAAVYLHGDDGAIKTSTGATITAADVLTETGKSLNTLAQSLQNLANALEFANGRVNVDPMDIQPQNTVSSAAFGRVQYLADVDEDIQTQLKGLQDAIDLKLDASAAALTYLTAAAAQNTYLTKASAALTYQTKVPWVDHFTGYVGCNGDNGNCGTLMTGNTDYNGYNTWQRPAVFWNSDTTVVTARFLKFMLKEVLAGNRRWPENCYQQPCEM